MSAAARGRLHPAQLWPWGLWTLFSLAVLPPEVDRLFNRHWTTLKTGQ